MTRTYTVSEAAQQLGFGVSTLYQHLHGNRIELDGGVHITVLRIGNRTRVPAAEIARVLCETTQSVAS